MKNILLSVIIFQLVFIVGEVRHGVYHEEEHTVNPSALSDAMQNLRAYCYPHGVTLNVGGGHIVVQSEPSEVVGSRGKIKDVTSYSINFIPE